MKRHPIGRQSMWGIALLLLYVASSGPAWGLYCRRPSKVNGALVDVIYYPLFVVCSRSKPLTGRLIAYQEYFVGVAYEYVLPSPLAFDSDEKLPLMPR